MPNWKHFTEKEILFPVFPNGSKLKTWHELENLVPNVAHSLEYTMQLVEKIREKYNNPIQITSAWRPKDSKGPHLTGKAIDFRCLNNLPEWPLKIFNILENLDETDFRIFWEYKGYYQGWMHIDRDYRTASGQTVFNIGYLKNKNMIYERWNGISPIEKTLKAGNV